MLVESRLPCSDPPKPSATGPQGLDRLCRGFLAIARNLTERGNTRRRKKQKKLAISTVLGQGSLSPNAARLSSLYPLASKTETQQPSLACAEAVLLSFGATQYQ